MVSSSQVTGQLKTFISYSRNDLRFAQRLVEALEQRGIQCRIDTRDLPTLEDWRRELLGFIREADAVVFVISPSSIESPICAWEVDQVRQLNKRLAPVVLEPVPNDKIPETLSQINYLFFDHAQEFETQSDKLASALQTDLAWVKEHTRLSQLARRWDERARPRAFLLRGRELEEAEHWISIQPRGAPAPTDLHRVYLSNSRQGLRTRQRTMITASLLAAVIAIGLAGMAVWQRQIAVDNQVIAHAQRNLAERSEAEAKLQRNEAEQQRASAQSSEKEALIQRLAAEDNERRASAERDRALLSQSRSLTDLAKKELALGRTTRSALLALEALPDNVGHSERPWYPPAEQTLLESISKHHERSLLLNHNTGVTIVETFAAGKRFWTLSRAMFVVWNTKTLETIFTVRSSAGPNPGSDGDMVGFALSHDEKTGLVAHHDGKLTFIDMPTGKITRESNIARLSMNLNVGDVDGKIFLVQRIGGALLPSFGRVISFSPDDRYLVALGEPNYDKKEWWSAIHIYRVSDMAHVYSAANLFGVSYPTGLSFSGDGKLLFTAGDKKSLVVDLGRGTVNGTLELEFLPKTEDPRFSLLKTSAPKVLGLLGTADDPLRVTATSVEPPNTILSSHYLADTRVLMVLRGGEVATWDIGGDRRKTIWKNDATWFASAALSKDKSTLAVGTVDGKIILFGMKDLRPYAEFIGHRSDVHSLAFHANDTLLLSVSLDRTAKLWKIGYPNALFTMSGATDNDEIRSATLIEGDIVVTGHQSGALRTWNMASVLASHDIKGNFDRWSTLNFTKDSRWLISTEKNDLLVVDRVASVSARRLRGHKEVIIRLLTDPTSQLVATSSLDGTVRIWRIDSGAQLYQFGDTLPPINDPIEHDHTPFQIATRWKFARAIAFSPDGTLLFVGRNDGVGEVRNCQSGRLVTAFGPSGDVDASPSFNPRKGITSVVFSPDGRYVVAGRLNGTVVVKSLVENFSRVIAFRSGKESSGEITAVAFDKSGTTLSVAVASKAFNFASAAMAVSLRNKHTGGVTQSGFELDDNFFQLKFLDILTGQIEGTAYGASSLRVKLETREEAASPMDLNIDEKGILILPGKQLVDALHDGLAQERRAMRVQALGWELAKFKRHFGSISGIIPVDDNSLLTWGHDSTLRIWNIGDHSHRAVLLGAHREVTRVVASHARGRVAAAAGQRILVWDPRDPNPLADYEALGEVADLEYSPDGTKLAAVIASGIVRIWEQFSDTQSVVEGAKSILNRCLTQLERRELSLDATTPDWCISQRKYPFRFARIGVGLRDITPQDRERLRFQGTGGMVADVGGLPALLAGLRRDDVIYQVGSEITNGADGVTEVIRKAAIGKALELGIWRDGALEKVIVYPGGEN